MSLVSFSHKFGQIRTDQVINYSGFIIAKLNKTMQNILHTMNKTIHTYIYSLTWDNFYVIEGSFKLPKYFQYVQDKIYYV